MDRKNLEIVWWLAIAPALAFWGITRLWHLGEDGRVMLGLVLATAGTAILIKRNG